MKGPNGTVHLATWDSFLESFKWRQGEHVSLIGPTGAGKTTLALQLLPRRRFVAVIGSKPRDATLSQLEKQGYALLTDWPKHHDASTAPRVILWPKYRGLGDAVRQRRVINRGLQSMFAQGGWTIYVDELRYVSQTLRLRHLLEVLWQQGRSVDITVVGGTQRPAFVPVEMYDQATHLFFWRDNDRANLDRIGGIGFVDAGLVRETVAELPKHGVLYVNTRDGTLIETKVELPK